MSNMRSPAEFLEHLGASPSGGDLVKCDSETTTQNDIDRGVVNMLVGFTPLKPAEFVILQIDQLAGQDES